MLVRAVAAGRRRRSVAFLTLGASLALAACTAGPSATPITAPVARATITTDVHANGALSATGNRDLGFPQGGKLTSVRVKVGQRVEKGQVLATVDDYAAKQTLAQQEANLAQQSAALARVDASTSVSAARSAVAQAHRVVAATRKQIRAAARADSVAISSAARQLSDQRKARNQAQDAVDDARSCGLPDCSALVASAEAAYASAKLGVSSATTGLATARQKKKVDAAAGQTTLEVSKASVVTAESALDSAVADRPHSLDQQQALVTGAEAAVRAARRELRDTTLRAPSDGIVAALNGKVGEVVSASSGTTALAPGSNAGIPGAGAVSGAATGTGAAATRPGGTQFIVLSSGKQLRVVLPFEESDAATIRAAQQANVEFDAVPGLALPGTVLSVSPSSTAISGVNSFYVTVRLTATDARLRDGQTARVTVTTQERADVLSVPNAAVHQQGSVSAVIMADSGGQHAVTFRPGVVGLERTEVLSGLTEGQQVVLPAGAHP